LVAEQAGGGRGDARPNPAANAGNRGGWCGARAAGSQPATRAASGPDLGVLRPLREELADGPVHLGTRKRGPELSQSRKTWREPQQGVERRAGPVMGRSSPAIWRWARSRGRATGCGASAPAPVGALLPSFSGAEQTPGRPHPIKRAA